MKAFECLPQGYREILSVDLQKNKKLMLLVNGIAIVLAVLMFAVGIRLMPISTLFDMSEGMGAYFVRFGVLLVSLVLYMVLHELTHAAVMKLCGTKRCASALPACMPLPAATTITRSCPISALPLHP